MKTRQILKHTVLACLLLPMGLQAQPHHTTMNISLFGHSQSVRGLHVGLFSATAKEQMYGVQIGGVTNAAGSVRGVQIAGITNIAHEANGLQVASLTNACTSPMRGILLSGITNIAMGVKRGVQFSGVANVCASSMRGVQAAMYNYSDTLSGSQFGFINVCDHHPRGVQVGIINISKDTVAHKIGLVNVNPKTRIDVMLYGGNITKTNAAVRFRNHSTYNIIGFGTHYMGFDEKFSGALFYRIGQYFPLSERISVSGDLGYAHIETFQKNSDSKPERLYSLQARMNLDYQLGKLLGAFVTLGYADTRYYCHNDHYRSRLIVEAGITLKAK